MFCSVPMLHYWWLVICGLWFVCSCSCSCSCSNSHTSRGLEKVVLPCFFGFRFRSCVGIRDALSACELVSMSSHTLREFGSGRFFTVVFFLVYKGCVFVSSEMTSVLSLVSSCILLFYCIGSSHKSPRTRNTFKGNFKFRAFCWHNDRKQRK